MSVNVMQFKARIRNFAQEEGIPAQVALQNFVFERFFARLCKSDVRENLILKGGALISHHLGLSRRSFGVLSTRPRDYYDVYMLTTCLRPSDERLKAAFLATMRHRGTESVCRNGRDILAEVSRSEAMKSRWEKYRRQFPFARQIPFEKICNHLITLLDGITT